MKEGKAWSRNFGIGVEILSIKMNILTFGVIS